MGQRGQVTAGPDAPLLRHQRHEPRREHLEERLHQRRTHPARGTEQHIGAQRHHRAHDVGREWRPHPGRVTADQVGLQPLELIGRDADVGELAEPGVDAVDRGAAGQGPLHQHARGRESGARGGIGDDLDPGVARQSDHIGESEGLAGQGDGGGHGAILTGVRRSRKETRGAERRIPPPPDSSRLLPALRAAAIGPAPIPGCPDPSGTPSRGSDSRPRRGSPAPHRSADSRRRRRC